MHILKKIFTASTGYWIHKVSTLPVGADLFIDIHERIKYPEIKIIFDVGANIGQTWKWFRDVEPKARIFCFEPVANTFSHLESEVKKDPLTIIEKMALGEKIEQKEIKIFHEYSALNSLKPSLMNNSQGAQVETVRVNTLDQYCVDNQIRQIDFLKIDTEGYEINVLQGSENMLASASVSMIYCEIGILKQNIRNTYLGELTEYLAKRDYHFFGLYQLVADGWKDAGYFGNALFVHKSKYNP